MAGNLVRFTYKNHRGETRERAVEVTSLDFLLEPGYGYQPGWFLSGYEEGKGRRSFALCNIIVPVGSRPLFYSIDLKP